MHIIILIQFEMRCNAIDFRDRRCIKSEGQSTKKNCALLLVYVRVSVDVCERGRVLGCKGKSHVLIGAFSSQILGNLQEFGGFGLREKVVFAQHITR